MFRVKHSSFIDLSLRSKSFVLLFCGWGFCFRVPEILGENWGENLFAVDCVNLCVGGVGRCARNRVKIFAKMYLGWGSRFAQNLRKIYKKSFWFGCESKIKNRKLKIKK